MYLTLNNDNFILFWMKTLKKKVKKKDRSITYIVAE